MATQTPFRYPGSKNKLLSILMTHLDKMLVDQNSFADVFVGGGSVLLEVATKYPKLQLFANDKDRNVYCFWKIIADADRTQLLALWEKMSHRPTVELFNQLRQAFDTADEVECAYRGIFFNRTTFSGIARSGPIGGQEQKSKWTVDCRYNFFKLKAKMEKCHQLLRGRTNVENRDVSEYDYLIASSLPAYVDPPYMQKGDALYSEKMSKDLHTHMAKVLDQRPNWVLSYDDCPEVRALYANHQILNIDTRYCIDGEKKDWKKTSELIIVP